MFSNNTKRVGAIVFGIGLLMCIFNLVLYLSNVIFMATTEQTTGYVKDVQVWETHNNTSPRNKSVHHDVAMTVEYTVDGVVYDTSFMVGNHSAIEGSAITVYYKKSNPEKASTGKEAFAIDGFVCFVFLLLGGLVFLEGMKES